MTAPTAVGRVIEAAVAESDMSRRDILRACSMSHSTMYRIVVGQRRLDFGTIKRLAERVPEIDRDDLIDAALLDEDMGVHS